MPSKQTPEFSQVARNANELARVRQATEQWQQLANPFVRLSQRLSGTLSLEAQIAELAEALSDFIGFDQLTYRHQLGKQELVYATGLGGQHRCDYRLSLEGECYGSLSLTRRRRFEDEELEGIEQMLAVAICPIRNACRYAAVQQTALTDSLTNVPNKRAMDEALTRACCLGERHQETHSLILCDLDHFKDVNDTYGHVIGDHLLKACAREIELAIRQSDGLYRFGGEEFAVLLPHTSDDEARNVAERIRMNIASIAVNCGETNISVTCSAGIATRIKGESPEQWLARADEALYRAKAGGRNQLRVSAHIG